MALPQGHAAVVRELVVPVLRGDSIVAVVGVGNRPSDYADPDIEAVYQLANLAWDIAVGKRAEEEKATLERHLQQSQKLESLGVLAGGIAHDFNNILAVIIGYCGLTRMDYETAAGNIPEIEKAAERAAGLCRQMLAYAGKAQLSMTRVDMGMLVQDMVLMLKSTLPQNASIQTDIAGRIPPVNGDVNQLTQVVLNLIVNASEAIGKEQGEIRVLLAKTRLKDGHSVRDFNGEIIPSGDYVRLEVSDNGCGMDSETKLRIFEPFYSTKITGRGLGMSAVLGIIRSHRGALQLLGQLGQGTTFKVYLPVQTGDFGEDDEQLSGAPQAPWLGSGTVLLVEDEDQVRLIARTLLIRFGFAVVEAENGKDALELYRKNAAGITLVVTDIGMPVMDGYKLVGELKKLAPELPIIVTSGFGDAEVGSRLAVDDLAGLVNKPYHPDQLLAALKRIF